MIELFVDKYFRFQLTHACGPYWVAMVREDFGPKHLLSEYISVHLWVLREIIV